MEQEFKMSEPVKIVITMEGGAVTAILSAGVAVDVVFIDYCDTGEVDPNAVMVPQSDGGAAPALVYREEADANDSARALDLFALAEG